MARGVKTKWTEDKLATLKANYSHMWNYHLCMLLNVTIRVLQRKARDLKLEKDPSFRDDIDFASFSKGKEPWNKGKKIGVIPGTEKGHFKKGHVPPQKNNPNLVFASHVKRNEQIRKDRIAIKNNTTPKYNLYGRVNGKSSA